MPALADVFARQSEETCRVAASPLRLVAREARPCGLRRSHLACALSMQTVVARLLIWATRNNPR